MASKAFVIDDPSHVRSSRCQVKSFEGPLEFYYPGQPDMTLVAGSVNVMGPLGVGQGRVKPEKTHVDVENPLIDDVPSDTFVDSGFPG